MRGAKKTLKKSRACSPEISVAAILRRFETVRRADSKLLVEEKPGL